MPDERSYRPAVAGDVKEGKLLGVLAGHQQIVMTRIGGALYAVDGVCTHQYADLDNACLTDDAIVCHFHGSAFNVRTGSVIQGPATEPLQSHAVALDEDRILIGGQPAYVRLGYTGLLDRG